VTLVREHRPDGADNDEACEAEQYGEPDRNRLFRREVPRKRLTRGPSDDLRRPPLGTDVGRWRACRFTSMR
jgi:hypothetical protein